MELEAKKGRLLKKVGCNATNSAAIDDDGNLWTWGSGRYGLNAGADPHGGNKYLSKKLKLEGAAERCMRQDPTLLKPVKIPLIQYDALEHLDIAQAEDERGEEFNAFNLLDPPSSSKLYQVLVAQHISYGSYHAGVVFNDIYPNYDFYPLPTAQQDILKEFKDFLKVYWEELQKTDKNKEVKIVQEQYYIRYPKTKKGQVSEQMMVEYMLRYFNAKNIKSTFPFVPLSNIKDLMTQRAKMSFKDPKKYNKLFNHLTDLASATLDQSNMKEIKKHLKNPEISKGEDYINLKELRDQIMKRRCSNGQLMMWGIANDGRLGLEFKEFKEAHQNELIPKGLQLVLFPEITMVAKVECGSSFTLVLSEEGLLYSWGFGKSGSLGLGETSHTNTPDRIQTTNDGKACIDMIDISSGSSHSLALDRSGKVYSWGNGQGGRLGHDAEVGENAPRQIKALKEVVKQIEAGDASSACLTTSDNTYLWGSGLNGRLGNGTSTNQNEPQKSQELKEKQVSQIVKGTNTTFAILKTSPSVVMGWGSSKNGKLGFPLANGKNYDLPKEIISLKDIEIYQIAAGPFHTLLLTVDGKLYSMGNSKDGKLGYETVGASVVDVALPEKIPIKNANKEHVTFFRVQVAKTEIKQYPLFNDFDEFTNLKSIVPKNDTKVGAYEIKQVKCGENFQLFLTNVGEVYACGSNKFGQLGAYKKKGKKDKDEAEGDDEDGNEDDEESGEEEEDDEDDLLPKGVKKKVRDMELRQDQPLPLIVNKGELKGLKVKSISVGAFHVICLLENDAGVVGWGKNTYGQLGFSPQGESGAAGGKIAPIKIKQFSSENCVKQVACGENHSIFLLQNGTVQTCGSNEFGQLGIPGGAEREKTASVNQLTTIDKSKLGEVQYVAAGRFHTMVISKKADVEQNEDSEEEKEQGDKVQMEVAEDKYDENGQKIRIENIKHDIYGWGRGYHGQLGLKDLKVVQWEPAKIKLKRDPRFNDEMQPSRFAMVTCGERHSLLLAVNGSIWWTGSKSQVGFEDPNMTRKNQFEAKVERDSFQDIFIPYFDPTVPGTFQKMRIKYISSNFNSKINFAVSEANEACWFGQDFKGNQLKFSKLPSQHVQGEGEAGFTKNRYIYGDSGKDFQTLINVERLPYTWGDAKNGRLGIDLEDKEIRASKIFKKNRFTHPAHIPFFEQKLRTNKKIDPAKMELLRQKFNQPARIEIEDDDDDEEAAQQVDFELRFDVQQKLKAQDQNQYEQELIQQDIDLVINFKSTIQSIYESNKLMDRQMRGAIMKAQDAISGRIQTFPIPNIDKLDDIEVIIPDLIILNKQIYECLFTLLQTHPCYLINWICAAIRQDVDLFDDHPQAFQDTDEEIQRITQMQNVYSSLPEIQIQSDEFLYLLIAIFGGLKTIRNDRRIINTLMVIGVKVFDYELTAKSAPDHGQNKPEYGIDEILTADPKDRVECVFVKIHRLVFQSHFNNLAFTEELLDVIVKKLHSMRSQFTDGVQGRQKLDGEAAADEIIPIFDYESAISNIAVAEVRAENLQKFLTIILEEILTKNLDYKRRLQKQTDCNHFFSDETLLMTLKARYSLAQKIASKQKGWSFLTLQHVMNNSLNEREQEEYADYIETADLINQFSLRVIFEDLCLRLQHLKAHDIIRIVKQDNYQKNKMLDVGPKRNNFFYLGAYLRAMLSGGKVHFTNPGVKNLKDFIEGNEILPTADHPGMPRFYYRTKIQSLLNQQKGIGRDEVLNFDQVLVQQTIEEAMEINNPIVTIQLRNIVYVHNQLVKYGEKNVYVTGFESDQVFGVGGPTPQANDMDMLDEEEKESGESEESEGDQLETDPIKMIMDQLGNQFIILRVYDKEFIQQKLLDKSINFLIRTRIFENYNQIVRCNHCNAIVYQNMIPKQRFHEAINMKAWKCGLKKCSHYNTQESSLTCKKCGSPRPRNTLPEDLVFPLYVPQDPSKEINRQATAMEKLLQIIPYVDKNEKKTFEDMLKDIKQADKMAAKQDFEKIKIIDEFLNIRNTYIDNNVPKAYQKADGDGGDDNENGEKKESPEEERFYKKLTDKIQESITIRLEHQSIIDKNIQMIKDLNERQQTIDLRQKQLIQKINTIRSNAKTGTGSLLISQGVAGQKENVFAGKLEQFTREGFSPEAMNEKKGKKKNQEKPKEKPKQSKNEALEKYFSTMDKKQNMTMNNQKLQKQLEENRERRNIMKQQFGQFSSFPAEKLIAENVVLKVKIGGQKIDSIIKKCNYLFYEIKEEGDNEGGYKVELSFEEKKQDFCGIGAPFSQGQKQVGNNNQSILSTFIITNETLAEMRRVMATKCTVNLGGTHFNIFKLVKLINTMKTQNQQYADDEGQQSKKAADEGA